MRYASLLSSDRFSSVRCIVETYVNLHSLIRLPYHAIQNADMDEKNANPQITPDSYRVI